MFVMDWVCSYVSWKEVNVNEGIGCIISLCIFTFSVQNWCIIKKVAFHLQKVWVSPNQGTVIYIKFVE
jgi:hypothetical protein